MADYNLPEQTFEQLRKTWKGDKELSWVDGRMLLGGAMERLTAAEARNDDLANACESLRDYLKAAPDLLEACKAANTYWRACAADYLKPEVKTDDEGHFDEVRPELDRLADIAAEKVHAAIAKAQPDTQGAE